jgi:hypothetical protein
MALCIAAPVAIEACGERDARRGCAASSVRSSRPSSDFKEAMADSTADALR